MTDPIATPPAAPPVGPPVATSNPGSGLAIAGIVLDFIFAPLGLILSIVAKVQSNKAGVHNTAATVGVVLGIIFSVISVIAGIAIGVGIGSLAGECAQLGAGVHHVGAATYTCGS
jgi:hypothetical protein